MNNSGLVDLVHITNPEDIGSGSGLPTPTPADAGKVLGVLNSSGDIGWVEDQSGTLTQVQADWSETDSSKVSYIDHKPNLATVATSGAYSDLTGTPTIPTVDQTYNASSANAQSGVAVAEAIAAIPAPSVDEVPDVGSTDGGKVLTASYSGGVGSYSWQTVQSGTSYTAGDGVVIDGNNVISADVDGVTIGINATTKKLESLVVAPVIGTIRL